MECRIIRTGLAVALLSISGAVALWSIADRSAVGALSPTASAEAVPPPRTSPYTRGFLAPGSGFSVEALIQAQQRGPDGRARRRPDLEPTPPQALDRKPYHEFYFTRAVYSGDLRRRWRASWATDFPKADRQFLYVIGRTLELLDLYELENPVRLDDPALLDFPFLYALEVGGMSLTEPEVEGLRDYLERGGFLVIDDFWGTWEWEHFEDQIRKVFPDRPIVELTPEHELFNAFYEINEIIQVPSVARARRGGPTWEQDGYEPHVRGIFDDDGRLMVVINWNTDLGDAWEWSEHPDYPFEYSNFAHKLGVNFIIYSMTH